MEKNFYAQVLPNEILKMKRVKIGWFLFNTRVCVIKSTHFNMWVRSGLMFSLPKLLVFSSITHKRSVKLEYRCKCWKYSR
jgi:hypothetical protein